MQIHTFENIVGRVGLGYIIYLSNIIKSAILWIFHVSFDTMISYKRHIVNLNGMVISLNSFGTLIPESDFSSGTQTRRRNCWNWTPCPRLLGNEELEVPSDYDRIERARKFAERDEIGCTDSWHLYSYCLPLRRHRELHCCYCNCAPRYPVQVPGEIKMYQIGRWYFFNHLSNIYERKIHFHLYSLSIYLYSKMYNSNTSNPEIKTTGRKYNSVHTFN